MAPETSGATDATDTTDLRGTVVATNRSAEHTFTKIPHESVRLLAGLGVEGDAHMGETVKHRSRVARDPDQPNLRQVHLQPTELHAELRSQGFDVGPGIMGENITTEGIDLDALPVGTVLRMGDEAEVELTGLRNPCPQLNGVKHGLMKALVFNDGDGNTVRLAGVMGVVRQGGEVRPGDTIVAELPPRPHVAMDRI